MTFDEIAGHPNGVKEIRHSSKSGLPSRRKHPPKPDLDPINSKWLPKKYANSGPRNGSAFLGAPFCVFNRRPRKWVQIAAPEMGPWTHLKIQKFLPRINNLGPKRAQKVASGEGQQHSAPEMINNMSWPEMDPLCGGRQSYQENLCEL